METDSSAKSDAPVKDRPIVSKEETGPGDELSVILKDYEVHKKKYFLASFLIFLTAILGLFLIYTFMPQFTEQEKFILYRIPLTAPELTLWSEILKIYCKKNLIFVLFTYVYCFAFMQCFCIPGHGVLSLLAGTLWGLQIGLPLSLICSTIGSSCAYFLSYSVLKGCITKTFSNKVSNFYRKVKNNKDHLFYYSLFIRITPLVPNMLVNVASPIAGIPLKIFVLTTFIGLIPLNFIQVSTGATLVEISKIGTNNYHFLILILISLVALVPTWIQKQSKFKEE